MTKVQLLRLVFNLNKKLLTQKGFLPIAKEFEFIKEDFNGYSKIQFSCAKVGTRFYLTYGLLLRIIKLENIVNLFTGNEKILSKDRSTILTSAIYLRKDPNNKQYIIDEDADILKVNNDFQELMNDYGFSWLEQYNNNISLLDTELNSSNELDPSYLQALMRPIYGIAAAKLNNNKNYDLIVRGHLSLWEEKAKENLEFKRNLERIELLVEYLSISEDAKS